jgi:hypothetical protein
MIQLIPDECPIQIIDYCAQIALFTNHYDMKFASIEILLSFYLSQRIQIPDSILDSVISMASEHLFLRKYDIFLLEQLKLANIIQINTFKLFVDTQKNTLAHLMFQFASKQMSKIGNFCRLFKKCCE